MKKPELGDRVRVRVHDEDLDGEVNLLMSSQFCVYTDKYESTVICRYDGEWEKIHE